jgi:hypothetical protein
MIEANPPMEQQQTLECVKNKGQKNNNGVAKANRGLKNSNHKARSPSSSIASLVLLALGDLMTIAVMGPNN